MEKRQETTKKLAHVQVYETLYKMFADGTFPVGTRLPSEPKLSKMLGVSRMTLRQALDLLHDDGKLIKIRGAGNFVADKTHTVAASLEQFGHPVFNCVSAAIEEVTTEVKLQDANAYERELLHLDTLQEVVAIHIWYKSEGKPIGYTFGVMAPQTLEKYHLDFGCEEEIAEFVQRTVYGKALRSQLRIHPVSAGNSILAEYMEKGEHITMVSEKIFGEELCPVLCNKHYLVTEKAVFEIHARR